MSPAQANVAVLEAMVAEISAAAERTNWRLNHAQDSDAMALLLKLSSELVALQAAIVALKAMQSGHLEVVR